MPGFSYWHVESLVEANTFSVAACGFSPTIEIQPGPPALGVWNLGHCTTRRPLTLFLIKPCACWCSDSPGAPSTSSGHPSIPESRRPWAGCSQKPAPPRSLPVFWSKCCGLAWGRHEVRSAPLLLYPQFRLNAAWVQKSITLFQSAVTPKVLSPPSSWLWKFSFSLQSPRDYKPWGRCQVCAGRGSTWLSWAGRAEAPKAMDYNPVQPRPGPSSWL